MAILPDRRSCNVTIHEVRQNNSFLFTIIFVIFFAFNIGTFKAIPILNQYKSAKEICDKAYSLMKSGENWLCMISLEILICFIPIEIT